MCAATSPLEQTLTFLSIAGARDRGTSASRSLANDIAEESPVDRVETSIRLRDRGWHLELNCGISDQLFYPLTPPLRHCVEWGADIRGDAR